jgi:AraC family transcriptional regulator
MLLTGSAATVRDVRCQGSHAGKGPAELSEATHIVFPYRGAFVRHVEGESVFAGISHVLFFNAGETQRISHPVAGGDACLSVNLAPELLEELAPSELLEAGSLVRLRTRRHTLAPSAQALLGALLLRLRASSPPLASEPLLLALLSQSLRGPTAPPRIAASTRKLVERVKLLLESEPARRWTLAEIGAAVGASPVYLTQIFRAVEGVPLYRYQLQWRLARALMDLDETADLGAVAVEFGFAHHSHFADVFRRTFGLPPSALRRLSREPNPKSVLKILTAR